MSLTSTKSRSKSSSKSNAFIDLEKLKQAAEGLWPSIHTHVLGYALTTKHGPCAIHEGTDKSRGFDDYVRKGGGICNDCGPMADGFEVIRVHKGCSFPDAIKLVADYLGIEPTKSDRPSKESINPTKNLHFSDAFPDQLAKIWSLGKKPIDAKVLPLLGARFAQYRKRNPVFALPAIGKNGNPVGWCLYHATNKGLPIFEKGSREPVDFRKIKNTSGSEAGWIGPPAKDTDEVVWKLEGPSDLLTLLTLGLPANYNACTNIFGAGENPASNPWMIERFKGKVVYVLHDCDEPGQAGAIEATNGTRKRPGWAPAIASVSKECRNVVLPYPIEKTHGKDLRDWVNDRLAEGFTKPEIFQRLLEMAKRSTVIQGQAIATSGSAESSSLDVDEDIATHVDDPHRLARANIEYYRNEHQGELKYWQGQWLKFNKGRWRMADDMLQIITGSIHRQFKEQWQIEFDRYKAWLKSDAYDADKDKGPPKVRKVTRSLTSNVMAALESICREPSSTEMPCLLPERIEKSYLNFQNGILDLNPSPSSPQREMIPSTPNWFSMTSIDYALDANARCPKWESFLSRVMEADQERINQLQEFAGYILIPNTSYQKFLALEGPGGNGKSVFQAGLQAMVGKRNVSHVTLEQFGDRFALGPTIGKMLNLSPDSDDLDQVSEGVLRQFVSGDLISIDRKNRDPISVKPTAKMIIAWNNRPRFRDRTDALFRRMLLVPFNVKISDKERVLGMDDPAWWIHQGEAPGIMNWAIFGLCRLRSQGRFSDAEISKDALSEYREHSNPASEFLRRFVATRDRWPSGCPVPAEFNVRCQTLFRLYRAWCDATGHRSLKETSFGREVYREFPGLEKTRTRVGKERSYTYEGISVLESAWTEWEQQ